MVSIARLPLRLALSAALSAMLLAAAPALVPDGAAVAQNAPAARTMPPLSGEDRDAVKRVEAYLNDVQTMEARFSQIDSNNVHATGKIYLSRPGRLRFEYDPPVPVLIVANGRQLIHYDRDLKTASYINQRDTPAWFLLSPTVEFQGDVTVTEVQRRDGKLLVSLIKTAEPNQGMVTLILDEDPMRLDQWAVADAQGIVTYVMLEEPKFGTSISAERFRFDEPVWSDRR
ncbi:MAG: LolA family protein [Alphaproteobacteria bacterium]